MPRRTPPSARGEHLVKGLRQAERNLRTERNLPAHREPISRERELIVEALARARAGARGSCVITGPRGAGKSRLARALSHEVVRSGGRMAVASCARRGSSPLLRALAGALRELVARRRGDRDRVRQILGARAPYLAAAHPELARLLGTELRPPRAAPKLPDGDLCAAIADLGDALAPPRASLALVLDDLDGATTQTLRLLKGLIFSPQSTRWVVVVTVCAHALAERPPLAETITAMQAADPALAWIALEPPEGARAGVRDALEAARQRCEELEREIELRDDFLSIAAHELSTPVASLKLGLDGIRTGAIASTPANLTHAFRIADRQVGRLAQLLDELLSVSKLQAGTLELARERFDLGAVAREAAERLEDEAKRAGSTIAVCAPGAVEGHWDRTRLDQVVTNLLSNAIKFGRGAPIDLRVDAEGEAARLAVCDRGIGIPPDKVASIFERFTRGVSSRHYGGLGLGLYIVAQIVQALGGELEVESTLGEGSTFTITLPRQAAGGASPA